MTSSALPKSSSLSVRRPRKWSTPAMDAKTAVNRYHSSNGETGMLSAGRIVLIAFVAACVIAGGGVLYLDVGNHPMSYYSVTGEFDYQQAFVFALIGALYLGPLLFFSSLMLYGLGYILVFGLQALVSRK